MGSSRGTGPPPTAVVVGGGLGGLTAAVALHRAGWQVQVLERASTLAPVGAGIAVAPNALRALDVVGVGDAVRAQASMQGEAGFRTPEGRWLLRMDFSAVAGRLGDPFVVLPRATLVDLLLSRLPTSALHLGATVLDVDPGDAARTATVTTDAGDVHADLVVAADGARSGTRTRLFPDHPGLRYAGYTAWRFLLEGTVEDLSHSRGQFETWGRGERFSALPMAGAVYCWATATAPPGGSAADERAELLARFGRWHDPVPTLIRAASAGTVLRHDAVDLARPLPALHRGRTALVGDAAHAMTPDLGQGGCMAMEDAVVLAHLVAAGSPDHVPHALARYTAERLPRTSRIARRSRRTGRLGQAGRQPAVALRTAMVRAAAHLPTGALVRALAPTAGWVPPGTPTGPG